MWFQLSIPRSPTNPLRPHHLGRYHHRPQSSTPVAHLDPEPSNERPINPDPSRRNIYSAAAAYQCIDKLISSGHRPHSTAALSHAPYDLSINPPSATVYSSRAPRLYNLPGRFTTSSELVSRTSDSYIPTPSKHPNTEGGYLPQSTGKFKQLLKPALTRRLSWTPSTQHKSHTMTAHHSLSYQSPDPVGYSSGNPLKQDPGPRARKVSLGDPSTWRWPASVSSQNAAPKARATVTQSNVNPVSNEKLSKRGPRKLPPTPRSPHVNDINLLHLHSRTSSRHLHPSTTSAGQAEPCPLRPAPPHTSQKPSSVARHTNTRQSAFDALVTDFQYPDRQSSGPIVPSWGCQASINGDATKSSSITHIPRSQPLAIPPQLRRMICPAEVVDVFVAISMPETDRGVELCGLLLGTLNNHVFTITTLLIPKQISTADTCATTDEDEVFRFQTSRDLMTLGWIHTHPTQTCFMSSLDLHTHASYQLMLPEAVAIVCSPKQHPAVGVFRLTDPPGLQTIVACRELGSFHPHPDGVPLYTDADGHLVMSQQLTVKLVDLRA